MAIERHSYLVSPKIRKGRIKYRERRKEAALAEACGSEPDSDRLIKSLHHKQCIIEKSKHISSATNIHSFRGQIESD